MTLRDWLKFQLWLPAFLVLVAGIIRPLPGFPAGMDPASPPPLIGKIRIEIVDYPDGEGKLSSMARGLLPLAEGERFSPHLVENGIDALRESGRFEKIHVDSSDGERQIDLTFSLSPYPLVKDIRISRAFPVFKRKILNAMTTFTGDAFEAESIPRQQERVESLFKREGFIAPIVDIDPMVDPRDGNVTLKIAIDKGTYYKLKRLSFNGNRSLSDFQLKRRMKTWRASKIFGKSGRFIQPDLKEDIKTLTAYYRKKRYAEAVIRHTLALDKEQGSAEVVINIEEGPRYRVEYEGNQAISRRRLQKDLTVFKNGNRNRRGQRKSAKNMLARYRKAGFLDAKIKADSKLLEDGDKREKVLRFHIDEGRAVIVETLNILGNRAFDDKTLMKNILTRPADLATRGAYSPESLDQDIRAVRLHYTRNGYLDADIHADTRIDDAGKRANIDIIIDEGEQTRVASLTFKGLSAITRARALEAVLLKPGEPFRQYLVRSDADAIYALIAELGYPHIKVEPTHAPSADGTGMALTYEIDEGPRVFLDQVFHSGNFRTRSRLLDREFELAPGDPLSPRKLFQSQKNIRDLGLFDSVQYKAPGLSRKQEEVDLIVEVEEKKPYFVEIGGGYMSDRGFFANARLGDSNFMGMNRHAWIGGEVSEIGYHVEASVREPRLLGSEISTVFNLFGERREEFNQTFGTDTRGANLGFKLEPWEKFTAGLVFRYEYRNQFETGSTDFRDQIVDDDEFDARNILVATPSLQYDSRDSFIRPRKGVFSIAYIDVSQGLENDLDNFVRYRLDVRYFRTPLKKVTLAVMGRFGHIDPLNSAEVVSQDQLFYLGGISDVRGFGENLLLTDPAGDPLGGLTAISGSVEARIDIGGNWEVPLFIDAGRVSDTFDPLADEDWRASVGSGLRYITPIGPIGILYGYKLERRPGESPGQFHISVGYTF